MMRIGSGRLSGRRLHAPKGAVTRPTSARLKKSLFDVLAPWLPAARVLDLFAGAGALGLEALSRGASSVVFVERSRKAMEAIVRNVAELGLRSDEAELQRADVLSALRQLAETGESFAVVLADPPYGSSELSRLLPLLGQSAIVAPEGVVVVEHHHKQELLDHYGELERFRELKAGESCFTLYRRLC